MKKKKPIKTRSIKCRKCNGSGTYESWNGYDHRCDWCEGTGRIKNGYTKCNGNTQRNER